MTPEEAQAEAERLLRVETFQRLAVEAERRMFEKSSRALHEALCAPDADDREIMRALREEAEEITRQRKLLWKAFSLEADL